MSLDPYNPGREPTTFALAERVRELEDGLATALSALAQMTVHSEFSGHDTHDHELAFGPQERTHLLDLAVHFNRHEDGAAV
jgi:hypothetical protein